MSSGAAPSRAAQPTDAGRAAQAACSLPAFGLGRPTAPAACLVSWSTNLQMNYQYKHLVGAMIVAGWDEHEGGQVGYAGSPCTPIALALARFPTHREAMVCLALCYFSTCSSPKELHVARPLNWVCTTGPSCPPALLPALPVPVLPAGLRLPHRRHNHARALDHRRLRLHLPVGLPGL